VRWHPGAETLPEDVPLPKEFPESDTWHEMNAALQDMRYCQHFPAVVVAGSLETSCLEGEDTKIALAAADFGVELREPMEAMELGGSASGSRLLSPCTSGPQDLPNRSSTNSAQLV